MQLYQILLLAFSSTLVAASPVGDPYTAAPRVRNRSPDEFSDLERREFGSWEIGTPTIKVKRGTTPNNVINPAPTPSLVIPPPAQLLDLNVVARLITATLVPATSQLQVAATQLLNTVVALVPGLLCGLFGSCPPAAPVPTASGTPAPTCLGSAYTETMINSLFKCQSFHCLRAAVADVKLVLRADGGANVRFPSASSIPGLAFANTVC